MVIPFSKIRYFTFNNYLICTITIPIPSPEEFHVFKTHSTPIYFDFNTDYTTPIFIKSQISYNAIFPNNESHFTTNENFLASCHQNGLQNFCHSLHSIYSTQNNPICETSMFIKSQAYKCKIFISFNEYSFLTPFLSHHGWLYSTILPEQIFLSCSKNSKTLINLQGIGILQIESDCNLDSSVPYYNIKNYPKIMDNSNSLHKSTTSLKIISPFLYNMSITEPHSLKNVFNFFRKKDDMLISTFESHVFILAKYANIQKIIPSIFNSCASKIYIAHTIVTCLIILILLIILIKIRKISKNLRKIPKK